MRPPPLVGRALLRAFVPAADHEYVAGDLLEELRTSKRAELGGAGARRWYVGQAARSAGPFLLLRLRRGELLAELAVAQLLVLGALLALDGFWSLVLSAVPLRAAAITPGFAIASVAVCAAGAAAIACLLGATAGGRRHASPFALTAFVAVAALALAPVVGVGHFVSPVALTAGLCAGALLGGSLARANKPLPAMGRRP